MREPAIDHSEQTDSKSVRPSRPVPRRLSSSRGAVFPKPSGALRPTASSICIPIQIPAVAVTVPSTVVYVFSKRDGIFAGDYSALVTAHRLSVADIDVKTIK